MDGDSHLAAPGLSEDGVGDGTLVRAAVVGRGRGDAEDVKHLIRKSLFHLNSIHGLREVDNVEEKIRPAFQASTHC